MKKIEHFLWISDLKKLCNGCSGYKFDRERRKEKVEITEGILKAYKEDERKQKNIEYLSHEQLSTSRSESEAEQSDSEDEYLNEQFSNFVEEQEARLQSTSDYGSHRQNEPSSVL